LYLYSIKIQTNIDKKKVKNLRKITDFFEIIFEEFVFGLGPATRAWSLAQATDPNKPCTRKILGVHGYYLRTVHARFCR